jgi:hypothetical protein
MYMRDYLHDNNSSVLKDVQWTLFFNLYTSPPQNILNTNKELIREYCYYNYSDKHTGQSVFKWGLIDIPHISLKMDMEKNWKWI